MKSVLLASLSVLLLFSCKKKVEEDTVLPPVEQPEVENTSFTVAKVNSENRAVFPIANTANYLLGYGYDINGRYADSSSVRNQVVDMQQLEAKYPGRIDIGIIRETGSPNMIVAEHAEVLSRLFSERIDETKMLRSFKNSLTSLNDSGALSKKYSYGWAMYYIYWKRARVLMPPIDSVRKLLSQPFNTDVASLSPADLVKKYGTHILTEIKMGSKLELTYQAEVKRGDKETKALIGLSRGSTAVFGLSTGYYSSGPAYINSNENQKIYYRTAGGNTAYLPQLPADGTVNPKIDFTNWFRNSTIENSSMIDIGQFGLIPLSNFVFDPAKKAALKAYLDSYITINRVTITD